MIVGLLYKDNVIKFPDNNEESKYYYFEDIIFQKMDYDTVLTIMDLENRDSFYRYFEENDNEYIYTLYEIETVWGDWNINNRVSLVKYVTTINKTTGTIEQYKSSVKEDVEVPNSAPHLTVYSDI